MEEEICTVVELKQQSKDILFIKEELKEIKAEQKEMKAEQKAIYEISQSVSLLAQSVDSIQKSIVTVITDVSDVKRTVNVLENKPGRDAVNCINDLKQKVLWLIVGGAATYLLYNILPYIVSTIIPAVCK